jgi:DNA replication protein DnaC
MATLDDLKAAIQSSQAQANVTTPTPPRAEFSKAAIHPAYIDRLKRDEQRNRATTDPWQERFRQLMLEVGSRYANCTLENFEVTNPAQRKVLEQVSQYANDMPARLEAGQGLVLFGPSGTGKDHLMVALMRKAILEHRKSVRWLNGASLFAMFRDAMDSKTSEESLVKRLSGPHVLVLSDPQPAMGTLTPYQSQVLFQVIDERYRSQSPTWVTMNAANGAEAEAKIGTATVDRMRDGALTLFCNWPSFRKVAN